jgi:acyl-coenzyme A thioesterase PaaI-like protein
LGDCLSLWKSWTLLLPVLVYKRVRLKAGAEQESGARRYRDEPHTLAFSHFPIYFPSMPDQSNSASSSDQLPSSSGDFSAALNAHLGGWAAAMGIHFVKANGDEVVAELEIASQHHQAYGIVHGGVYSGLIETIASVGAALWAQRHGQTVVGLENQTSFLLAVREGKL